MTAQSTATTVQSLQTGSAEAETTALTVQSAVTYAVMSGITTSVLATAYSAPVSGASTSTVLMILRSVEDKVGRGWRYGKTQLITKVSGYTPPTSEEPNPYLQFMQIKPNPQT